MAYKKHDSKIKYITWLLQDTSIFANLGIPRTTLNYWVNNSKNKNEELSEVELSLVDKIKQLKTELQKEQKLRHLLYRIKKIAPLNKDTDKVRDSSKKKKVLEEIENSKKFATLNEILNTIGLSKSAYFRWRSEIYPNTISAKPTRLQLNQLTYSEISKMRYYLSSREYMHYPIHGLFYHALRNDDIICSKQTWYKYAKIFNIKRWNRLPKYKIKYEEGIRATKINEIWHIDVTQFSIEKKKIYLQVIMDNYSRYIISYQITSSIGALSTVDTIKKAQETITQMTSDCSLMMDAGTENRNTLVDKFLISKNIKRVIAKIDLKFSNSMVESLFRSLKNNYLYHQNITDPEKFKRKVDYYFQQHNECIPHSAFKGGTPKEVYMHLWSMQKEEFLKEKIKERLIIRRKENIRSFYSCKELNNL